jgi:DNA-binding transcriptional LysR family regulator
MSLRRLEKVLRAKLVRRTSKGVELTAEGSVVLARVRDLRLSLQNLAHEVADVSEGRVGHLRIGVGFARPEEFLSTAFAILLKDAPRLKLIVTVSDNDLMFPALRNGELDLFVNYLLDRYLAEGCVAEHLYVDEHVVCASARHRLAGRKHVTLADLAQERWAVSAPVQTSQQILHEKFRDAALPPPQIALECRSAALRLRTVVSSDLLDWTSRGFVEHSVLAAKVKILPVKELRWPRPVGVVFRRENYQPSASLYRHSQNDCPELLDSIARLLASERRAVCRR